MKKSSSPILPQKEKIMQEIWKEVKGYEGIYEVSNLGNVRSLDREVWNGRVFHHKPGRVLKPIMVGKYHGVQLMVNGKSNKFYIHRLVAQAFIKNPHDKKEVNHIDGNKFNNILTNLEWNTRKENEDHAFRIGLKNSNGENNPNHKFSDETVKEIRRLYNSGQYRQFELSNMFGVSRMQVSRIVRNILRKEVI